MSAKPLQETGLTVVFGAGYVGGALACELAARGEKVVALTRNAETASALERAGVGVIIAGLETPDWRNHCLLEARVARVAVTVASGGGGADAYRRSYMDGLASVLAWGRDLRARGESVGPLVYTGSTSVYPQGGGCRITEDDPIGGEAETVQALVEAERQALDWPGAGAVVLRLSGIYGPGRGHLVGQVRSGEVAGWPETRLNLIHRDDIVTGIQTAWAWADGQSQASSGVRAVFNLSDSAPAPKGEVVAWLAHRLGVPLPAFTGRPAGTRRAVTPDRVVDATRAREVMGWRPRYTDYRTGYEGIIG